MAALLLTWLSIQLAVATEYLSCGALRETALSPGFWRPAVIMNSLDLSLENLRPAPVDQQVELSGLCDGALQSTAFNWQKPSDEGGEWLATTGSSNLVLNTGTTACRLTGLALGTSDPTLRMQFEECDGKAAVIVRLQPQKGGMKLVQWICAVTTGTELCKKAAALVRNNTVPVNVVREDLDLAELSTVLSKGVLHTNARSACFEHLHWFTAQNGLGVDSEEWPLLVAIRQLLEPKKIPEMPVEVEVQVAEVCFMSCKKEWDEQHCGVKPVVVDNSPLTTLAPIEVPKSELFSRDRLEKFGEALRDPETAPWVWLLLVFGMMLGVFVAMLMFPLFAYKEPARKGPLRYKQVELVDGNGAAVPLRMTKS